MDDAFGSAGNPRAGRAEVVQAFNIIDLMEEYFDVASKFYTPNVNWENSMRFFMVFLAILLIWMALIPEASAVSADEQISEIQQKLKMGLPLSNQFVLNESQNAWQRYRDTRCRYRTTSFPLIVSEDECLAEVNADRIKELLTELHWLVGIAGNIPAVPKF